MEQATATTDSGKLLLIEEEWAARMKEKSGEASSSRGGDGKRRGMASSKKKKKKVDPNACRRYGKTGHWAKECPNRTQEKAEAHLAQADEDDEATLLMATFCALYDIEAKKKGEVMAVEGHGKALKAVNLDEPRTQVHLGRVAVSWSSGGTWALAPATT